MKRLEVVTKLSNLYVWERAVLEWSLFSQKTVFRVLADQREVGWFVDNSGLLTKYVKKRVELQNRIQSFTDFMCHIVK